MPRRRRSWVDVFAKHMIFEDACYGYCEACGQLCVRGYRCPYCGALYHVACCKEAERRAVRCLRCGIPLRAR